MSILLSSARSRQGLGRAQWFVGILVFANGARSPVWHGNGNRGGDCWELRALQGDLRVERERQVQGALSVENLKIIQ